MSRLRAVAVMSLAAMAMQAAADCQQSRAAIRFATDPAAGAISRAPVMTTIEDLHATYTKRAQESAGDSRISPEELTVYQIDGVLRNFEGDWAVVDPNAHYILTLSNPDNTRAIQTDLVAPGCAENSPFIGDIRSARAVFDTTFTSKPATRESGRLEIPVRVTGVGFFETGYGWRTLRLSPILKLEFSPPSMWKTVPAAPRSVAPELEKPARTATKPPPREEAPPAPDTAVTEPPRPVATPSGRPSAKGVILTISVLAAAVAAGLLFRR